MPINIPWMTEALPERKVVPEAPPASLAMTEVGVAEKPFRAKSDVAAFRMLSSRLIKVL
jgi:hypothetical protein